MYDYLVTDQGKIRSRWSDIRNGILEVMEERSIETIPIEYIYHELMIGVSQLWIDKDFFCISTLLGDLKYPYLQVQTCKGDSVDSWLPTLWDNLKRFAKDHNCTGVRVFGRPGWIKKIKDKKRTQVLWEVEV